jgi:hypothetical protein
VRRTTSPASLWSESATTPSRQPTSAVPNDEAQLRWFPEASSKPLPLLGAKQRLCGIFIRDVVLAARRIALLRRLQGERKKRVSGRITCTRRTSGTKVWA